MAQAGGNREYEAKPSGIGDLKLLGCRTFRYMTEKNEVRTLIEEAVVSGLPLDGLRGIAFFNTEKDGQLTPLKSFGKAEQAITRIPKFEERIGAENTRRVVLQFIYQYFNRVDITRYDGAVFESLWEDFTAEIENPQWLARGIANVRNLRSESHPLELGDGVAIRERNLAELASLGFSQVILDRIQEDWHGPGASSFVIVAEDSVPKVPDNIIGPDAPVWTKAIRTVGACRLAAAGSFSIGTMWVIRATRFNFGLGGLIQIGISIPSIGPQYVWSEAIAADFPRIYRELAELEKKGYGASPGNLDVALRAFMASYDRWPSHPDSQLLDSITALEAVLGTMTESTFRLAFRVTGLLAASDIERGELLKSVRDFYDTRSRVVHGGSLKDKHQDCLRRVEDLRFLVRRLLRSFVAFAASPPAGYDKTFFNENLDIALLNPTEREKLRTALGLNQ